MSTIRGFAEADAQLPKKAGDLAIYKYVDTAAVPEHRRRRTRKLVDRASARLSLGRVRIRYYEHIGTIPAELVPEGGPLVAHDADEEPNVFCGIAGDAGELGAGVVRPDRPDEIALLSSLRGELLTHTIVHELRHLRQLRDGFTGDLERDANTYAAQYVA